MDAFRMRCCWRSTPRPESELKLCCDVDVTRASCPCVSRQHGQDGSCHEKTMKHFISIADHSTEELRHIFDVAKRLKKQYKQTGKNDFILAGKTLAMVFEKPSLRTRVSFSVGMTQLGGVGMYLSREEVGLGVREPVQDVA